MTCEDIADRKAEKNRMTSPEFPADCPAEVSCLFGPFSLGGVSVGTATHFVSFFGKLGINYYIMLFHKHFASAKGNLLQGDRTD